ncbi:metabolite transporter, putative [Cryptococcus deneoformans JEC21]|uniref:Metabolite transporter, putative n=1 Tax=Cryptococcus deneoformans (strain JEC21 / ATCC MYA-565) TaxID=214684 RepID=Q5KEM0_CRYD1|nr:metabolite transporter, putative [Cryptococcus neoformans var. neoformans JEC21]AAW44414.1 metabolite transporter, putative [Cryptococcus neoformans var. neoformans JEC21]
MSTLSYDDKMGYLPEQDIDTTIHAAPLAELETPKKRKWMQTLSVLIAGVALFSDGYNIQITGYTNTVMAKLYPTALNSTMKTRLSNSILIGDIFGMILFGLCADRLGRRWGIIGCTFFLVLGVTLATAAHGKSEVGMLWMIVIGRGVAGLGAGGEYAVCTTSAVEAADETHTLRKKRGLLVASSTNTAIIAGFVASAIVFLIVLAAYGGEPHVGVWRICFGIGIIMPLSIFLFRVRMADSTLYSKHSIKSPKFPYWLAFKRYWKPLLGCSLVWFLYDAVVYPFNLLAPTITAGFSSNQSLLASNGWGALVNAFALPGAFFGGFIIDRLGPRQTYAFGLVMVAIFGFVIGGAMEPLRNNGTGAFAAFVILFGLFQCFLSVGPGNCNFIVSSESFPTPVRGHALGLAAAIGKAGAAVGTQVFPLIEARFATTLKGQQAIFLIGSGICVVAAIVVMTIVPNRRAQLEDEDVEFRRYLEENGWDTSDMGSVGRIVSDEVVERGEKV